VGTQAVEEIAAAARTTLAAGSARVRERVFSDPPRSTPFDVDFVKEGVSDLARGRTRVEQSTTAWQELWERLLQRFPWLDEDQEGSSASMTFVYAGTRSYFGDPRRGWCLGGEGDERASCRMAHDRAVGLRHRGRHRAAGHPQPGRRC